MGISQEWLVLFVQKECFVLPTGGCAGIVPIVGWMKKDLAEDTRVRLFGKQAEKVLRKTGWKWFENLRMFMKRF